MSLRRASLIAFAALFTIGMTSLASACCNYAYTGCGGCGTAAVTYAPPPVVVGGCGGCAAPPAFPVTVQAWGTGCGGCGRSVIYTAPASEPVPVAPAPIYVVNQGPEFSGPGIIVPYHTYSPLVGAAVAADYPYVRRHGYGYYHRWHSRYAYRGRAWRSYHHRAIGARG